jgi:hypothetical protein
MIHSIPKYVDITSSLLEFLLSERDQFDAIRRVEIQKGIHNSLKTILEKGVVMYVKNSHTILNFNTSTHFKSFTSLCIYIHIHKCIHAHIFSLALTLTLLLTLHLHIHNHPFFFNPHKWYKEYPSHFSFLVLFLLWKLIFLVVMWCCSSLEPLYTCSLLDPNLHEAVKKAFAPFIPEEQKPEVPLSLPQPPLPLSSDVSFILSLSLSLSLSHTHTHSLTHSTHTKHTKHTKHTFALNWN